MSKKIDRQQRYIVFKNRDVDNALTEREQVQLGKLLNKVTDYRISRGKEALDCVVVEDDWPMFEDVWQDIESWVDHEDNME